MHIAWKFNRKSKNLSDGKTHIHKKEGIKTSMYSSELLLKLESSIAEDVSLQL